ncbi:AAA family ATPase [uncultured Parabacteroides sp.]|uniref:AAA family ATPase n=1 Tax=uncultured Parabacteroides sp. TaxID=512312 RepID=UPI002803CFA5|nr:AAA family ATPase [uncultured Parabacteroides sp.]
MILKIEFENFYSIKDRIRIDFRAANINTALARELKHNVMEWNGVPVLKSVGLFGPNASGKSNILTAISFCCRMVLESHLNNEGAVFNFEPFKFDGMQDKPSKFLIDFVCENVEYEYAFELTKSRILAESLYHYPVGRRAKVFVRKADGTYSFGNGVIAKPGDVVLNTSDKNLFLSRASSMNREIGQKLYRYFMNQFLLGLVNVNDMMVLDSFNTYKRVILKALEICDTDITDIDVRKEQIPAPTVVPGQAELSYRLVDILRFKTVHRNQPDVMFDMDMEESSGTRKLFQILLRLLDVVKYKKGIMMDEFDMGLHTRLADFILDLIHASEGSQLLFSSHNTNLIDVKSLRRDQIVFVNKTENGATEVYSLYDFKDFRENMDAEKGYIQGRFDAVPYVDSSVECIKQLLEE